jgi:hypothetical protein
MVAQHRPRFGVEKKGPSVILFLSRKRDFSPLNKRQDTDNIRDEHKHSVKARRMADRN